MAAIDDQDRYFLGKQNASMPRHLLDEGNITRLINGKFSEGSISNGIGFDELDVDFSKGNDTPIFASNTTYGELLGRGDVQLVGPLSNIAGKFLVLVISGVLFLVDTKTLLAYDITPKSSYLPEDSLSSQLSYLDNSGGTYGVGGYFVIFNYPNRPIFISQTGARLSDPTNNELPPTRLGVSGGERVAAISGDDVLWASDPLGGASDFAPLTFDQIFNASTGFTGQLFNIGSALEIEHVTAMGRLPKFLGASQDFIAQNIVVSTNKHKYIVALGLPRDQWVTSQFITYAGSTDGIAGPHSLTNIGDNLIYMSSLGRIKALSQDAARETAMTETFLDEPLGQYLFGCETSFLYRDWYQKLNHTRSVIKFNRDRLYATVYPIKVPAIGKYGQRQHTISHRALAVASMDSSTLLGSQASLSWEGFYDWMYPCGMAVLDGILYVVSKDPYGRIKFYRSNQTKKDEHTTTIYTRGYFSKVNSRAKTFKKGEILFRTLNGPVDVRIEYLVNEKWIMAKSSRASDKLYNFTAAGDTPKTHSWSIPLKIEIEHNGTRFELESVRVDGEAHSQK